MEKNDVRKFANEKIKEWGLDKCGWKFRFGQRKSAFGTCKFRKRIIEVSAFLLPHTSSDQTKDTVLHEIAHALDFMERGTSDHGPRWKAWARLVGAKPERCGDVDSQPPSPYVMKCDGCGVEAPRYRRPKYPAKEYSCRLCYHKGFTLIKKK